MTQPHRILSFGRRRGRRLRDTKQGLLETLLPELRIDVEKCRNAEMQRCADLSALLHFSDAALLNHLFLEIGFGSGEHLLAQAAAHPEAGIIGCEPYINGFGNLLMAIRASSSALSRGSHSSARTERDPRLKAEDDGIQNIRLFTDDARILIDALPDACLSKLFILFPDPWPKARHHKRRLIRQEFLNALARVMKPGAELLLATDHADYLAWMLEQLLANAHFAWTAKAQADWKNPPEGWVKTRYQEKAEAEGRTATWLRFVRK